MLSFLVFTPFKAWCLTLNWEEISEDLEFSSAKVAHGLISSSEVNLIRTSLEKYDIQVIRSQKFGLKAATAKTLCKLAKAKICINGSFFDEQKKPLGLLIEKGIQIQKMQSQSRLLTGVFERSREDFKIIPRELFAEKNVIEAIQAGPRLIQDGKKIQGLRSDDISDRRSGLCIDYQNRLIMYSVRSPLFGISTAGLQELLTSPEIGCKDALNLDGGSSSQFYIEKDKDVIDIAGADEVPIVIGLTEVTK